MATLPAGVDISVEELVAPLVGCNEAAAFGERFRAVPGTADLLAFTIKVDPETVDALDGRAVATIWTRALELRFDLPGAISVHVAPQAAVLCFDRNQTKGRRGSRNDKVAGLAERPSADVEDSAFARLIAALRKHVRHAGINTDC